MMKAKDKRQKAKVENESRAVRRLNFCLLKFAFAFCLLRVSVANPSVLKCSLSEVGRASGLGRERFADGGSVRYRFGARVPPRVRCGKTAVGT